MNADEVDARVRDVDRDEALELVEPPAVRASSQAGLAAIRAGARRTSTAIRTVA